MRREMPRGGMQRQTEIQQQGGGWEEKRTEGGMSEKRGIGEGTKAQENEFKAKMKRKQQDTVWKNRCRGDVG